LKPIADALSGTRPLKVIHNARFERRVLAAAGIALNGVFDTLETSRQVRGTEALGGHSLGMVCERELGIVLDKSSQTSRWDQRPLDSDQLRYAALDAEVLLGLYDSFSKAQQSEYQDENPKND
jgi:ribonuclease D